MATIQKLVHLKQKIAFVGLNYTYKPGSSLELFSGVERFFL